MNQQQQQRQQEKQNTSTTSNTPPSIERPGPEGEADEEEPSEVGNSVTPFLFLEFLNMDLILEISFLNSCFRLIPSC